MLHQINKLSCRVVKHRYILLTDAARYMTAACRVVKQIYPRLFHITWVTHGVHNAAEQIRANYEDVDKLIASVVKNKDRRAKFS